MSKIAESMIYNPKTNSLRLLNQLLLPVSVEYEDVKTTDDAWNAIKQMKVRGAPAIAICALLSVAVELGQESILGQLAGDSTRLLEYLKAKVSYQCHSNGIC